MAAPTGEIWRRIVPPLVAAFAVFLAMLRVASRSAPRRVPRAPGSWAAFARYLSVTALTGYLAMLAIVLVFHVVLARDHGALRSAAAGGATLLAIVVPVFAAAEWVARRRRS
jgi:Family of unknown function (DUF6256)